MARCSAGLLAAAAVLALGAAPGAGEETVWLNGPWRFQPRDDLAYAQPEFDDSGWATLAVDSIWEDQGHPKLDGYAWYRLRVTIPSRLRDQAHLKDGLRLRLGKINNFDQSFLNGRLFGINGQVVAAGTPPDQDFTRADQRLWNHDRCYVLAPDDPRILWDQENLLAVRVFDEGGQGGLFSGDQSLRMVRLGDYLEIGAGGRPFDLEGGAGTKGFELRNSSSAHTLKGSFAIRGSDKLTGERVYSERTDVKLAPGDARPVVLKLPHGERSCVVTYEFTFAPTGETVSLQEESPYVLTPPAPESPRINGPAVVGVRPGRPFLYAVAATGIRPMTFEARGLPDGLAIDAQSGIVTGRAAVPGEYPVTLLARNRLGHHSRLLRIVVGDRIALTPPMGWNSWNCWGLSVDQEKMLASARAFKQKGLADHGWSYVNLDDGWEVKGDAPGPKRDPSGSILTNRKFPDMKALVDRVRMPIGLPIGSQTPAEIAVSIAAEIVGIRHG